MKSVLRFWRGLISIAIVPAIAGYIFLGVYFGAGSFDRKALEGVVEEIRHAQFPPNEEVQFYFADFAHPHSFKMVTRDEVSKPRNVWATRSETGILTVSIMTKDRGHFGEYGFTYSDSPLEPIKGEDESYLDVPGQMRSPEKRIDAHWWKVANRGR